MKFPPKSSGEDNSSENLQSIPEPLENLYDLLAELAVAESPQKPISETNNSPLPNSSEDRQSVAEAGKLAEAESLGSFVTEKSEVKDDERTASLEKSVAAETPVLPKERNITPLPEEKDFDEFKYTNQLLADYTPIEPANELEIQPSLVNFEAIDHKEIDKIYVSQQWIVEKERKVRELADNIDSLLPLLVQLSQAQADNSEERILKTIVPVIDRVIKERSAEDSNIMADAIADLLPDAIRQEIDNVPESIGKAIAPELALSITEQIRLDRNAISRALGSEMGKAIKTQIELERDAMVDALYPVIGSTIAKYMGEVVESINQKVDNALSPEGVTRKIRAKIQGVSEAELILKESFPYSVRAAFLIQKDSGLVIREIQPNLEQPLESDLLAGMLTAIRSFANDCIVSNSELDEIDYGQFQILFETAGYCYLAVVVNGEPDRQFRDRMRKTFAQIITEYGEAIEAYQGDPATIPESVQPLLEEVTVSVVIEEPQKSPKTLSWLVGILLSIILVTWGIFQYRSAVRSRIERAVTVELDATPELSVYRLIPQVKKGELTLEGRVPSPYLRDLASTVTQTIATQNSLQLNNQILAVNVPVDPTITRGEIARIINLFNQKPQVAITTNYQNSTVTVDGFILNRGERDNLLAILQSIPGIKKVIFTTQSQLPALDTKIYFPSGVADLSLSQDEVEVKIEAIQQFLARYPSIKLKIIGHSDRQGENNFRLQLARTRANNVYQALIDLGINPQRLAIDATLEPPPNLSPEQAELLLSSRCVRFESFITPKE